MLYYERHLGDYAKGTAHLSMLEHGAYTLLMDRYYATEQAIPAAQAYRLARARTPDEMAAVDAVLAEFFQLDGDVWKKNRIEEELAKAHRRIEVARRNGKSGGRPPKNPEVTQQKPSGFSVGSEMETQKEPRRNPDPNPDITQPKANHLTIYPSTEKREENPPALRVPPEKSATRLPEDWAPSEADVKFAASRGLSKLAIETEALKFRNFWVSKAGKEGRKLNWSLTWQNWSIKASEDRANRDRPRGAPEDIFARGKK